MAISSTWKFCLHVFRCPRLHVKSLLEHSADASNKTVKCEGSAPLLYTVLCFMSLSPTNWQKAAAAHVTSTTEQGAANGGLGSMPGLITHRHKGEGSAGWKKWREPSTKDTLLARIRGNKEETIRRTKECEQDTDWAGLFTGEGVRHGRNDTIVHCHFHQLNARFLLKSGNIQSPFHTMLYPMLDFKTIRFLKV